MNYEFLHRKIFIIVNEIKKAALTAFCVNVLH